MNEPVNGLAANPYAPGRIAPPHANLTAVGAGKAHHDRPQGFQDLHLKVDLEALAAPEERRPYEAVHIPTARKGVIVPFITLQRLQHGVAIIAGQQRV